MQTTDRPSGPVLRLFEARAKPGRGDELMQKFATASIDVVRDQPGNVGYFYGRDLAGDSEVVLFASAWSNLDAVKQRFGASWQDSFLPEGYAELIDSCSVRHVELSPGWTWRSDG